MLCVEVMLIYAVSLAPLLRLLDKVQRSFAPKNFSLSGTCHPAPQPVGGCWLQGDVPWGAVCD